MKDGLREEVAEADSDCQAEDIQGYTKRYNYMYKYRYMYMNKEFNDNKLTFLVQGRNKMFTV